MHDNCQFSRVFEFSTVACPRCFFHLCSIITSSTSGSPGEQVSHEKPGTVCMGSWTQCVRTLARRTKRSVLYVWPTYCTRRFLAHFLSRTVHRQSPQPRERSTGSSSDLAAFRIISPPLRRPYHGDRSYASLPLRRPLPRDDPWSKTAALTSLMAKLSQTFAAHSAPTPEASFVPVQSSKPVPFLCNARPHATLSFEVIQSRSPHGSDY
jgi:hypothetical protein